MIATIEPFHGNEVAINPEAESGLWSAKRILLDDSLAEGHALATADFLGLGYDQLIAGWRKQDKDKKVGIRMKALLSFLSLLTLGTALANDSDDTLKLYLSKSDLVVSGTIESRSADASWEIGVMEHLCEFKVEEVAKGDIKLKGQVIKVNIKRFELDKEDEHPLVKAGGACVLFLKNEPPGTSPSWRTADFWFGIQQRSPMLLRSLKHLEAGE